VSVAGYTLAVVRMYLAAAVRQERRQQRDTLILMRAAQATGDGFQKVLNSLAED